MAEESLHAALERVHAAQAAVEASAPTRGAVCVPAPRAVSVSGRGCVPGPRALAQRIARFDTVEESRVSRAGHERARQPQEAR